MYFLDSGVCTACAVSCATCNNNSTCLTCVDNASLDNTTNLCTCNAGYYYNASS